MQVQEMAALSETPSTRTRRSAQRNMAICVWCLHRNTYECEFECQPEGKYRYLEPEPLPQWETPPSLPPFCALVDMRWAEVLAILWLHAYYLDAV